MGKDWMEESMKSKLELLEILSEAEEDVKNNRTTPIEDTFNDLRKTLEDN